RLLHSASEVPQAAAGVITQLRQDMALLGERDNAALAERTALIGQLHGLLSGLQATADQQRQALAQLAEQTTLALTQAAERFEA
ncbi:hypothetical protein, partial [Escherichia coli]|uniref:hypothetical protein n=1 Tax=Escherichia coli TaxID=562 RepID=UPI004067D64B